MENSPSSNASDSFYSLSASPTIVSIAVDKSADELESRIKQQLENGFGECLIEIGGQGGGK